MSTSKETFVNYIKEDLYGNALSLAKDPDIPDDLLRKTITNLLAIANDLDAELKARKHAVFMASSFFDQRESFKNDKELANDLLRAACIVEPPLSPYF